MTTSIGKLSKSFFVKVLVGIIILPFVFWGMGDVFRGGNQNVIATIESKKISTQEFMRYLNNLNLSDVEVQNIKKTDLLENILSEYIGKEVMSLEIEKSGIVVTDNSLRDIIINDELFSKDKKFSRTEYEKFLLKSGLTAPTFEKNIANQESRRQFLSFLAGGVTIPKSLVEKAFQKENQIKSIKYIDLNKYHLNKKATEKEIEELYEKNKSFFKEEIKDIQYAEITPQSISGNNNYDESFFKQLDILENNILDGQSFESASNEFNLKKIIVENIEKNKDKFSDNLFQKINKIKSQNAPEILKVENQYFLTEIKSIKKINKSLNDPDVLNAIKSQINFKNKIKNNATIIKDISSGNLNTDKLDKFAKDNNLEIKKYKISDIKQNEIFSEGIIKRIFATRDGDIDLITDSTLTQNFLVHAEKTQFKKLKDKSNDFEKYEAKARLNLVNKIYRTFDEDLNKKYNVELNQRTIERVKNSFKWK